MYYYIIQWTYKTNLIKKTEGWMYFEKWYRSTIEIFHEAFERGPVLLTAGLCFFFFPQVLSMYKSCMEKMWAFHYDMCESCFIRSRLKKRRLINGFPFVTIFFPRSRLRHRRTTLALCSLLALTYFMFFIRIKTVLFFQSIFHTRKTFYIETLWCDVLWRVTV